MNNKLLQTITGFVNLSASDIALFKKNFEPILIPKNRIIEEEGRIPTYLYYIVSGYMRLFSYNSDGEEITSHINCPPGFITSYSHFINQTKATENVECITDCELLSITKSNLDSLIKESKAFNDYSIHIFQQSLVYNENRSIELATLTAEQRYQKLIKNHPDILHNVPLQYIASFLGMNPKSLSRIRKQIN
jgi:CRP-like cAMP-binding protein